MGAAHVSRGRLVGDPISYMCVNSCLHAGASRAICTSSHARGRTHVRVINYYLGVVKFLNV